MQVVVLAKRRNRKVAAVARELLELAEAGDLQGLSFVAKFGARDHRVGVVGDYQSSPDEAIAAAVRMKQQLIEMES